MTPNNEIKTPFSIDPDVNYTKGPWRMVYNNAYQSSWLIYGADGNQIAQVANWQNAGRNTDAQANARIIASAPEMYEALKAQGQQAWMPIAEYDKAKEKHGWVLLLTHSGNYMLGSYNREFGFFSKETGRDIQPTHFQPLPAPPTEASK